MNNPLRLAGAFALALVVIGTGPVGTPAAAPAADGAEIVGIHAAEVLVGRRTPFSSFTWPAPGQVDYAVVERQRPGGLGAYTELAPARVGSDLTRHPWLVTPFGSWLWGDSDGGALGGFPSLSMSSGGAGGGAGGPASAITAAFPSTNTTSFTNPPFIPPIIDGGGIVIIDMGDGGGGDGTTVVYGGGGGGGGNTTINNIINAGGDPPEPPELPDLCADLAGLAVKLSVRPCSFDHIRESECVGGCARHNVPIPSPIANTTTPAGSMDSLIRRQFGPFLPAGVRVASIYRQVVFNNDLDCGATDVLMGYVQVTFWVDPGSIYHTGRTNWSYSITCTFPIRGSAPCACWPPPESSPPPPDNNQPPNGGQQPTPGDPDGGRPPSGPGGGTFVRPDPFRPGPIGPVGPIQHLQEQPVNPCVPVQSINPFAQQTAGRQALGTAEAMGVVQRGE